MSLLDALAVKFDGKHCATTSCGYTGNHAGVHGILAAFREEASQNLHQTIGAAQSAVHDGGKQLVASALSFVSQNHGRS